MQESDAKRAAEFLGISVEDWNNGISMLQDGNEGISAN
ncbi:hypothetical protein STRDD11_02631 [Streptococcus sp. DD11]|nr:hypothetical protein STRDD11_02631 [Streptococcus sp. DD11]